MPGPLFLRDENVTLRSAEEEDIEFLRANNQDPRVRASRSARTPVSTEWARERLGGTLGRNGDTLGLLICSDETPVGFCYLIRETPNATLYRLGELAYWITPDEWGNGYATTAGRLMIDHAFCELGLHRVTASTFESNEASKRVLEKIGFTQEGISRKEALVDGSWCDMTRYGLLAEEWRVE